MRVDPGTSVRDLARAWQTVLGRLQIEVARHNWETWFKGTRAVAARNGVLTVEAPSAFACEWLNTGLVTVVQRVIAEELDGDYQVEFVPPGQVSAPACEGGSEPLADLVGAINASYTFAEYLPAEGNRIALEACSSIVNHADHALNPIVVWGAPGLGKSHLLHALARAATERSWKVACLGAEEFTTRYMRSVRRGVIDEFQESVRGVQLFVLDDLQYLAGKKGTLDELVHTVDAVMHRGGHVVVASERHPLEMSLPDRLASRLSAGLITRVGPFSRPERQEFVSRLVRRQRSALPDWALDRVVHFEAPSVRLLQGATHAALSLQRHHQLEPGKLDAELMRMALVDTAPRSFSDQAVMDAIATHFATTAAELVGRSRKPQLTRARAVTVAALRERGRSLSEIATLLGGRDRSTISQLGERGQKVLAADLGLRVQLAG